MKKRGRTRARSNRGPGKRDAGTGPAARPRRESFIGFPGSSPFAIALFGELVEAGGHRHSAAIRIRSELTAPLLRRPSHVFGWLLDRVPLPVIQPSRTR